VCVAYALNKPVSCTELFVTLGILLVLLGLLLPAFQQHQLDELLRPGCLDRVGWGVAVSGVAE
jgi:hypothetical protein